MSTPFLMVILTTLSRLTCWLERPPSRGRDPVFEWRCLMATAQIEEKPRIITPGNSRRNEIVAILFLAFGLLLTLCLVSAAFYPNDPSWNSIGQGETHNWAGSIGASVAAALFQGIGLAAFLLPALFLASSWRRFRTSSIHAPWSRVIGLGVLVLAASALLAISGLHPLFD